MVEVLIGDKINSRMEEFPMARSFSVEVVMIVMLAGRWRLTSSEDLFRVRL